MKDLASATTTEQQEFFDSFDEILCDVDGVIWFITQQLPGSDDAIRELRKLGKRIRFVSNNSTRSSSYLWNNLHKAGFGLGPDDLVIPTLAIADYLKSINFTKEAFVVGTTAMKEELKSAGIKIAADPPDRIEEILVAILKSSTVDEKVGAVILDLDINLTYIKLQLAANYVKNPDVIFLSGAADAHAPIGPNIKIIGPKLFHQAVEDNAHRQRQIIAKPMPALNEFIVKRYNIKDNSRVLFIGDSVPEDMGFAVNCGYGKLLVLSGLTTPEALESWSWPEEYKPKYYVKSLKVVADILGTNLINKY